MGEQLYQSIKSIKQTSLLTAESLHRGSAAAHDKDCLFQTDNYLEALNLCWVRIGSLEQNVMVVILHCSFAFI